MQVLQVFVLNERGKIGYLAVLDSYKDGRQQAVKYMGEKYGVAFPICIDYARYNVKTVRSSKQFDMYVKLFNPALSVNPIRVGSVVFDMPFVHFDNGTNLKWQPYFEESVTNKSFSVISEGAILQYDYQQPIYLSVLNSKRHVAAYNRERVLINMQTGYTTRELSKADGSIFYEAMFHMENGVWACDKMRRTPIAGWKSR